MQVADSSEETGRQFLEQMQTLYHPALRDRKCAGFAFDQEIKSKDFFNTTYFSI